MKCYPIAFLLLAISFTLNASDPVAGRILFSNQPFNNSSVAKTSFGSRENIYGRLELSGSTIKEGFKLKDEIKPYPFLMYDVILLEKGEQIYSYSKNHILLTEENTLASSFNFDIMPDPSKATTLYSMLEDFSAGYGFSPMHYMILNKKPDGGKYQVRVRIYYRSVDGWGREMDQDKWPVLEAEFDYEFMESDIPKVTADSKKIAETVSENAFRHDKMPAIFSKGATITDAKATNAKVLAIIKRDLPKRTILKMVIEKTGTLWSIAKDDYGLPKYRYFYPHVYVAYKIDGKCYIGYITLREDYTGGGTFGPLHVGFTSGNEDKGIDCEKVK